MAQLRKDTVAQRLIDAEALPDGLTVEAFVEQSPDVLHLVARQGVGRQFDVRFSRDYVDHAGVAPTVAQGLEMLRGMYAQSSIPKVAPGGDMPHILLTTRDLPA